MKRHLIFLAAFAVIPLSAMQPQQAADVPTIEPAKPRRWEVTIPRWHPTTAGKFERLSPTDQQMARNDDRMVIEANFGGIARNHFGLRVDLLIGLSKGQHKPGVGEYWDAIDDAFRSIGLKVQPGTVTYTRSRERGEIETTVKVEEGR